MGKAPEKVLRAIVFVQKGFRNIETLWWSRGGSTKECNLDKVSAESIIWHQITLVVHWIKHRIKGAQWSTGTKTTVSFFMPTTKMARRVDDVLWFYRGDLGAKPWCVEGASFSLRVGSAL